MRVWSDMSPADFGRTRGTQLGLFAEPADDGCGTLDLLEAADQAAGDEQGGAAY